jgi:hypothetical protein
VRDASSETGLLPEPESGHFVLAHPPETIDGLDATRAPSEGSRDSPIEARQPMNLMQQRRARCTVRIRRGHSDSGRCACL